MPAPDPPRSPSLGTRPCACGPRSRCWNGYAATTSGSTAETGRYRPVATAGAEPTTAQAVPRELRACCGSPMHPSPGPNRCLSVAPDASRGWDAEYQPHRACPSKARPTPATTANPRSTLPQRSSRPLNDASDAIPRTSSSSKAWRSPCTRAPRARSESMPARRNARSTRYCRVPRVMRSLLAPTNSGAVVGLRPRRGRTLGGQYAPHDAGEDGRTDRRRIHRGRWGG
jgi:hypothetical protein